MAAAAKGKWRFVIIMDTNLRFTPARALRVGAGKLSGHGGKPGFNVKGGRITGVAAE
jgi:hypothetical protein